MEHGSWQSSRVTADRLPPPTHPPGRADGEPPIGGAGMTVQADTKGQPGMAGQNWYARQAGQVAADLGVDPAVGLPAARAADLLAANGPNALPEEKQPPGWRRFLGEYRSYMQIILIAAAVVSLVIKEWSTGVLLVLLT